MKSQKETSPQLKWILNIVIGLLVCGVGLLIVLRLQPRHEPAPQPVAVEPPSAASVPAQPDPGAVSSRQENGQASPPSLRAQSVQAPNIDPRRLAEAETVLVRNQMYEQKARATLPTLSLQTNNPVWALEHEAEERRRLAEAGQTEPEQSPAQAANQGPQFAPESGPFGKIQPPEGEIWLRIPAKNAAESRDIMAQNADLYRAETGFDKPVTITLWVGGRVYARQRYE